MLEHGEPFFARHGPKAVFLGRWVSGLRIASAWLAGMNRMAWPTFLFWNALGGIAWAASIGFGVYFLGHVAEQVISTVGPGRRGGWACSRSPGSWSGGTGGRPRERAGAPDGRGPWRPSRRPATSPSTRSPIPTTSRWTSASTEPERTLAIREGGEIVATARDPRPAS